MHLASSMYSVRLQHYRSWFRASPMPVHRYVEENGSAVMLGANTMAGVTPEVNLREHVTHMPLSSTH